jgi:hypothetical protein
MTVWAMLISEINRFIRILRSNLKILSINMNHWISVKPILTKRKINTIFETTKQKNIENHSE